MSSELPSPTQARSIPDQQTDLVGQKIDGRYRIIRVVGQGATGIVYQAVDERLQRDVAIKMLLDTALHSPETVARFLREADVLSKIVHPNVLPVMDTGKHGDCYYLVTSYIAGKTLKELIPPNGMPDPKQAVRLAITLAETLFYVYDRYKVLHRDVKPANLMLAEGNDSALYLMDFGLAYRSEPTQQRLTNHQSTIGTPAYMSPEQVLGKLDEIDHRTDIYSTGVTLYNMLTGKLPFTGSAFKLFTQITQTAPEPPSKHRPELDPALDRIVLKALAKRPADRYTTGREFAAALQGWLLTKTSTIAYPAQRSLPPSTTQSDAAGLPTTTLVAVSPMTKPPSQQQSSSNKKLITIAIVVACGCLALGILAAFMISSGAAR